MPARIRPSHLLKLSVLFCLLLLLFRRARFQRWRGRVALHGCARSLHCSLFFFLVCFGVEGVDVGEPVSVCWLPVVVGGLGEFAAACP